MLAARTVLQEAGRNFAAALVATTAMAFFMLSVLFLKRTPGVGMGFLVEIFPLFFPLALQFTVPLAMLTASVLTFSRMQQDGELTALGAAGIPPGTVVRPVLAGAAVVALCALLLSDVVAPFAAERLRAAKRDLIHQLQTSFRAGLRDLDFGRGRISFESFDGHDFEDICLELRRPEKLLRARRGSILVTPDEQVVVALQEVVSALPERRPKGEVYVSWERSEVAYPLGALTKESASRRRRADLEAWALAYESARGLERDTPVRSVVAMEELARRSALAASAFFFALAGIPLGILTARGGRVGAFLLAIAPVLLVFFPIVIATSGMAKAGRLPAYPALWAGNAVLAVTGLALLHKVQRR